jgi:L-iditol 2-dehydrogenase
MLGSGRGFHFDVSAGIPRAMKAVLCQVKPIGYIASHVIKRFRPRVLTGPLNGLSLADIPEPTLPGDEWVKLRTRLGGICGTDTAIIGHRQPMDSILQAFSSQPILLGHENVADVIEVGPGVDPKWVGKRVCVDPTLACAQRGIEPACHCCQAGHYGACENFGDEGSGRYGITRGTSIGYNNQTGGSLGQVFIAHESQLYEVPETLTDEEALLTDPIACSLHAVLMTDFANADRVLIYGSGIVGLATIAALRAVGFGGQIDMIGMGDKNCKLAEGFGLSNWLTLPGLRGWRVKRAAIFAERSRLIAEHLGVPLKLARFNNPMLAGGYDITVDCLGSSESVTECLKWTAARGQFLVLGTGAGKNVDLTPIWFRELTVLGAYGRQRETFQGRQAGTYALVHEFLANRTIDASGLLTHIFPAESYREAFDVSMHKPVHQAIKVALDFRHEQ